MTASMSAPRWWCCLLPSAAPRPGLACSAKHHVASRNRTFCDGHHIGTAPTSISTLPRRAGRLSDSPNPRAVLTYAERGPCPAPERGFLFRRATSLVASRWSSSRWFAYGRRWHGLGRSGRSEREPLARPCGFVNGALQPSRQNERCHENASDCLRLDRCGGHAGDTSTCLLLKRLPSLRTMPGVLRSVPAILWSTATILRPVTVLSSPAILWSVALRWSVALLWSAPAILRSTRLLLRPIRLR